MTDEPKDDTAAASGPERAPFELAIPVRIVNQGLAQDAPGAVDLKAVGGLQQGQQLLVAADVTLRTGDQELVSALALGKGFELVLREIATPGPVAEK